MQSHCGSKPHFNRKPDGPLTVEQRNEVLNSWLVTQPKKDGVPFPLALMKTLYPKMVYHAELIGYHEEDINASCLLGAVNAARLFDPDLGYKFVTFAIPHMRNGLKQLVRRDVIDWKNRGSQLTAIDVDYGRIEKSAETWDDTKLEKLLEYVAETDEEVTIVRLRHGLGGSQSLIWREIGEKLGMPRQMAKVRYGYIISRMKRYIKYNGGI